MKFTDLPILNYSSITDDHVFAVATNSSTDQLSLEELQRSFTGIIARDTNGISILGNTVASGIKVGDNGFVGINNVNPVFCLDVGDYGGVTQPQIRLTSSSSRKASYALADSSIFWKNTKKASDTDYYIEVSEDDSNYTGAINIDKNGNVGVFDGSFSVPNKFYVYNGDVGFQSGAYKITFDPSANLEIYTNTDSLKLNYSNNYGVVLGEDVVVVDNSSDSKVGINNANPSVALDVFGSGTMFKLTNSTTNATNISLTNTSINGYIVLSANGFSLGGSTNIVSNGFFYDVGNKSVGIGINSPDNKLHIFHASQNRLAKFENNDTSLCEVFQVNNATSGPWHNLYTFGRFDGSENTSKWGIGLYDDDGGSHDDYLVFRVDASLSDSAIKASLDRNGDFDIQGSYTSKTGNYCRGKFVHTYQTRLTGDCLYFNPFYPDSNTNPSGNNNLSAPFGIAPYNGRIEKIQIFSSDQDLPFSTANGGRFEISVITPSNDVNANNFVSGFYDSPTSPATSLPVSGIVSQFSLTSAANPNQVYTYSTFSGSPTFTAGQILQYRITDGDQRSSYKPPFTVVSTISYTVT